MKQIILLALGLILSIGASATEITCIAKGKSGVGGNDSGPFTSDSRLDIKIGENQETKALQMQAKGTIKVANEWEKVEPEQLTPENAYIGLFDSDVISEVSNAKARKYKDYVRFGINANETTGQEDGMWGYLVISKKFATADTFDAAYVFQAGDHMGGTLHFTCSPSH